MRLVEQVTLVFTGGRSEKVYEIDLCAVGSDRFVVNFRYGRRGKPLKDGTQTVEPVSEAKARAAFRSLIEQKQAQGYVGGPSFAAAPPPPEPVAAPTPVPTPDRPASTVSAPTVSAPRVGDARAQAVLDRLARGDRPRDGAARPAQPRPGPVARTRREIQAALRAMRGGRSRPARRRARRGDGSWSLTRAMWRAGEMGLGEATPLLIGLIGTGDAMRDYCAAWALARCGDPSAVGPLVRLYRDPATPPHVARVAAAALLERFGPDERSAFIDALRQGLPEPLRVDDAPALLTALEAHLAGPPSEPDGAPLRFGQADRKRWAALETLYLMNTAATRAAVMALLPELPLRPPIFQRVRAIFKIAELRRDAPVFGLLAHRFATTNAMFSLSRRGRAWVQPPGGASRRVRNPDQALRSVDAELAYGPKTRAYLRRRTWRTLRRLGELDDASYVPLAVGYLLAFSDDDQAQTRSDQAFNRILADRDRQGYRDWETRSRRDRRRERQHAPDDTRSEAFPHLWDRTPAGLMQLIDGSRCQPVHVFATRALRAQVRFLDALPAEALALIITARYAVSAGFGAELARARYTRAGLPARDRRTLAVAMAQNLASDARRTGLGWIQREPQLLLDAPAELARLAASPHDDVRRAMRDLLRGMRFDAETARTVAGALIAHLMGCGEAPDDAAAAGQLIGLLDDFFSATLGALGEPVIVDLAGHPLMVVQSYAARLMADRAVPIAPAALAGLLASRHPEVRVIALRILGLLDDDTLREASELLWSSLTNRDPTIRDAARPIVARLAARDPAFGAQILQMLIASLLRRRLPDGVPAFVVQVLREDFAAALARVPAEIAWRLLRSKDGAAQELGGVLLPHHLDPGTVDIGQLVELADHEVKAVRQAAWSAMAQAVPRLKADLPRAVAVLDSRWEDTRFFAFDLFATRFESADFAGEEGATVLVSICDSIRPEVQRFGRTLIAKHFDPAHGRRYLLELSEHPSTDVQLFASNYLREYAAGDPRALERLAPYFIRVLCGINRGRPAKLRAHGFLRAEALADRRCAEIVARIVTRQSATTAIEDRAACIQTMTAIHHRWPEIELPIQLVEPPLRARGA